jgi:polysaccharide biosynthesis transport protein
MSDAYAGKVGGVPPPSASRELAGDEFDLGSMGRAIRVNARPILGLTLLALILSFLVVSLVTPRYTGEAAILLESGDNFYTRLGSERDANLQLQPIDDQAVQSQVLLLNARELLIDAVKRLNLVGNAEFDPLAGSPQPWNRLLILAGLIENPANLSPEDRVLERFSNRLRVYPARGSRVINIEFSSADPKLAADGANMMADLYLKAQESAKMKSARSAGAWLSSAIAPLRKKVDEAEAKVEAFRASNGLLVGANNLTINAQQLADLNTQLANARAAQADALSKAKLLREMIKQGRVLEISEVANNELIRRLSEQRATLSAQMALEGRTLLPQHPRMKELAAQLADLDAQIRLAAEKTVRGLENDSRIAGSRVESVNAALDEQKKTSSQGNEKEVELRALEREAKAARDQLEAYMAKYREAAARESDDKAVPPDARIMARALIPSTPSFPRKIPIISISTLATLVFSMAGVVVMELFLQPSARRSVPPLGVDAQAAIARRVEPTTADAEPATGEPSAEGASAASSGSAEPESRISPTIPADAESVEAGTRAPEPDQAVEGIGEDQGSVIAGPSTIQAMGTTEIADIAAHLVSLKPAERAIILLVSRASDADPTPSFSLPLAREIAEEAKTVLVDLDGKAHSASRETGLVNAAGLGELMANRVGFSEAIHRDPRSSLHLVPAGAEETPSEGMSHKDLALVLQALARTYDVVLVDAPPLVDPAVLRALVDEVDVTLVVRGEADEAAMTAALNRFAAEEPSLLLAIEPAANDDQAPRPSLRPERALA